MSIFDLCDLSRVREPGEGECDCSGAMMQIAHLSGWTIPLSAKLRGQPRACGSCPGARGTRSHGRARRTPPRRSGSESSDRSRVLWGRGPFSSFRLNPRTAIRPRSLQNKRQTEICPSETNRPRRRCNFEGAWHSFVMHTHGEREAYVPESSRRRIARSIRDRLVGEAPSTKMR